MTTTLWIAWATGVLLVCASCTSSATTPTDLKSQSRQRSGFTAEHEALLNTCYEAALPRHPALAVDTGAIVVGRGGKILLADVSIPEAPELAGCIVDKLAGSTVPMPPGSADDAAWIGATRVALGGPSPRARPSLRESMDRVHRLLLEGRRRGLLRDSDRLIEELLHPRASWPTADQNAQLDECYRASLREHPGLVVHASASYLARGNTILVADVPTPKAPELGRCLEKKIAAWTAPSSPEHREDAVVSGFFVHLGAAPEFPEDIGEGPFAQRDRLVSEAVRRGLLPETDALVVGIAADRARRGAAGVNR